MRILLITETLHAGGAEIFVLRLCRKLQELGHSSTILNLNPDIENQALLQQYPDVRIRRVNLPWLRLVKKIDSLFLKLRLDFSWQQKLTQKWVEKNCIGQYEVYHTHLIKVDYLFSLIKKKRSEIKVVSTSHGDYAEFFYKFQAGKTLRWLNFNAKLALIKQNLDTWIVINEEQLLFFVNQLQIPAQKLLKIYNGFEANFKVANNTERNKFVIGMVARGVKLKGWDILIAAFKQMPENCELVLVGTGDFLDSLKEQNKLNSRIKFMGFQANPAALIAEFDVFVLPTLFPHEALPTVIMEALFCKKPVIATNVGEIPQMLVDPDSGLQAGFLLDFDGTRVRTEQLVSYLMQYYRSPNLVQEHGATAEKAFKKFNMRDCAENYLKVYST